MSDAHSDEDALGLRMGTRVGQYRVVRHLGAGGMADVYEAEHEGLSKRVALKVLRPELASKADVRRRFLHEGTIASRIRHPNVVDVTDVGTSGNLVFLVMELLSGDSLQTLMEAHQRLPIPSVVDLMLPILAALGEAHERGVIHRDVKPDNILLARTRRGRLVPKLVDFGISKLLDLEPGKNTVASSVIGTPQYMAPEQARGEEAVDARADQFSAAMVLYEALSGVLPYRSQSVLGILQEASAGQITRLSVAMPEVPAELEAMVMRALAPLPQDRYPRIEDFAIDLLPFASDSGRRAYAAAVQAMGSSLSEPPRGAAGSGAAIPAPAIPPAARVPDVATKETLAMEDPPEPASAGPRTTPTDLGLSLPVSIRPATIRTPVAGLVRPRTPRARALLFGAGAAGIVAFVGLALWLLPGDEAPPRPVATEPTATQPAPTTAPGRSPSPIVVPVPARPASFRVAVDVEPPEAEITLDDEPPVQGRLDLELARDGRHHRLVVSAPGYRTRDVTFVDAPPPPRIALSRLWGRSRHRAARGATMGAATHGVSEAPTKVEAPPVMEAAPAPE